MVYVTIGVLAMREALGLGCTTTGPGGAMQSMGPQPQGGVLLVVLAAGLVGYALWQLVQGIMDPDQKGSDPDDILRRVGYVGSGVIHGGLAFIAAQSVFGAEDSSEDAMALAAMAFQPPLGPILVGLVGLIVMGVGLYQLYAAYGTKFRGDLKLNRMSDAEERWVILAGRVGCRSRPRHRRDRGFRGPGRVPSRPERGPWPRQGARNPPAPALGLLHTGRRGRGPSRPRRFHASRCPLPSHRTHLSCGGGPPLTQLSAMLRLSREAREKAKVSRAKDQAQGGAASLTHSPEP